MNTEHSTPEFDWNEHNIRHLRRHQISQAEFEQAAAGDTVFISRRLMAKKFVIPVFDSQVEESEWFDRHKKEVEDELVRAMDSGDLQVHRKGDPKSHLHPVIIRLSTDDLKTARERASQQGVEYQTHIRMVLHKALRQKASRR
jgi:predicted DNA binding CopG/RHH family protein